MLHNTASKPGFPLITDDYLVEVKPGSLVKLIDLVTFWNVNHDIIKAEEDKIDDRATKEEKELQTEQKVEGLSSSEECGAEGNRPDNKKEVVQGGESASQKPKRRRVRKPRE